MYVVPFVAKVIESCAKSRVFKHPNPWTTGILNLLAELHQEQDLKLNLKFEIEVSAINRSNSKFLRTVNFSNIPIRDLLKATPALCN